MPEPREKVTDSIVSELVKTLISVIEEKDDFLKGHAERVASTCVHFGVSLGLPKTQINQIYLAGLLHDIGMVSIPIEIIKKAEALSKDELDFIKKHPVIGEKILSNLNMMQGILPIVRHHHESFDGSGYPDGLKGEEIPFESRLLNIANSYDALTSNRHDRPPFSTEDALKSLQESAGKKFDENLVEKFLTYMDSPEKPDNTVPPEKPPEEPKENNAKAEDKKLLQESIARIVKKVKSGDIELPVLPNVIQEIQKVMSEPNANVDNLAVVIEKDAVVSLKVISAANSPFYRGTEKIRTVDMAISRLGFKETQSIVNVIANKSLYETKNTQFRTLMEKLWLHSLATAYSSRILSKSLALGETEKYFFMGLIHDIGKTLLLKVLGDLHPQIESLEVEDIITSVQDIHTGFGGAIIRRWGFSEEYIRITLLHEGPNFSEKTDKDVLLINIANNISHNLQFCAYQREPIDLMDLEAVKYLGVESEIIDSTIENVTSLMEETATIF